MGPNIVNAALPVLPPVNATGSAAIEAGYLFQDRLVVGGALQDVELLSGGRLGRVGLELAYRFSMVDGLLPWVGVGAGFEWGFAKETTNVLEDPPPPPIQIAMYGAYVAARLGFDWQISPSIAIGPFMAGSYGGATMRQIEGGVRTSFAF